MRVGCLGLQLRLDLVAALISEPRKLVSQLVAMPVVLPAKVHLNFGAPMYFDDLEIPEEQVTERVEKVKAEISRLIDKGLSERKKLF